MRDNSLKTWVDEYLAFRRSLGYSMTYHESMLRSFTRFVVSHGFRGHLKRHWVEKFVAAPRDVHPVYRRQRHRVLVDFARYWAAYNPHVEIPMPYEPGISYKRQVPYIYSDKEIQSLMVAARSCRPPAGNTYSTVIGLMACTGLRTGETINLCKTDVDFEHSLLRIQNSKNRPLRLVPIHRSAAKVLQDYVHQRDARFPLSKTDHFFLNRSGHPLSRGAVEANFRCVRRRTGIVMPMGCRQPRAHDLRHTFACNRLLDWLREGRDVSRSIHHLATYLGHEGLREVYWYLTAIPALFEMVGQQFERYAAHDFRRACQ